MLTATSPRDADRRTLFDHIEAGIAPASATAISYRAYHARVYLAVCRMLQTASSVPPKVVVVPVNLRSFSNSWNYNPVWRFDDLVDAMEHPTRYRLFGRIMHVFGYYPRVSEKEYESSLVIDGEREVGTIGEFNRRLMKAGRKDTPERTRDSAIANYMTPVRPDHEGVLTLKELTRTVSGWGGTVVYYITPVDSESCAAVLGERFLMLLSENTNTIRIALTDSHSVVLDLATAAGSGCFAWKDLAEPLNEHLNEQGRSLVASAVARQILRTLATPQAARPLAEAPESR